MADASVDAGEFIFYWAYQGIAECGCDNAANPGMSGAPNLNLTPEEKRAYGQLFRQADTDNVGVVTGEVAVKFFEKTRLDSRVLGEVS
jgi:hypothetical protein